MHDSHIYLHVIISNYVSQLINTLFCHCRKELEEQLEAEQYFTTLYKTQVNELTDEVDDSKERDRENQNDKEALVLQIKSLVARADNDARYVLLFFRFIFCPKAPA